jgi:hypothetical protein
MIHDFAAWAIDSIASLIKTVRLGRSPSLAACCEGLRKIRKIDYQRACTPLQRADLPRQNMAVHPPV